MRDDWTGQWDCASRLVWLVTSRFLLIFVTAALARISMDRHTSLEQGYIIFVTSWFILGALAPVAMLDLAARERGRAEVVPLKLSAAAALVWLGVLMGEPAWDFSPEYFWETWPLAWRSLAGGMVIGVAIVVWRRRRRARFRLNQPPTAPPPLPTTASFLL
jgi:hypothetical protein